MFKHKYNKYKNKNSLLLKNMFGGVTITLPDALIKGPHYMYHLSLKDKNIYLFGEVHKNIDEITCRVHEKSKTMLEWLKDDVITKYVDDSILDIFIELPYKDSLNGDYTDEQIDEDIKIKLTSKYTLNQFKTLVIKPPKNTRIHTIDIRNELNGISINIGYLDIIIRLLLIEDICKKYILDNHTILLECTDIIINWNILPFFNIKIRIIDKNELITIINTKLIKYIEELEKLSKDDIRYKSNANFRNMIDAYITKMKEIISTILLYIEDIPWTEFSISEEFRDDLLYDTLINKNFNKIDDTYKPFYIKFNQELFKLKDEFIAKYNIFKQKFIEKLLLKARDKYIISNYFVTHHVFLDFENITEVQESLIDFTALIMDIYTIGRLLKPYIKSCIVYTGSNHSLNIKNKLLEIGFEIRNKAGHTDIPINLFDNSLNCLPIKDLNLII